MKITLKFLKDKDACKGGIVWWREHQLRSIDHTKLVDKLMEDGRFNWANWLLTRVMTCDMCVKYSKYAAECAEYAAKYAKNAAECAKNAAKCAADVKKGIIDYGLKLIKEK